MTLCSLSCQNFICGRIKLNKEYSKVLSLGFWILLCGNLESELRTQIKVHLFDLKEKLIKYFLDIDGKRET